LLSLKTAVDGGVGDGVFAAAIDANDEMVAAASTAAAQLMMTIAIAAATIGQRKTPWRWMPLHHHPSIPSPPLSRTTAVDKDHRCRGRHLPPLPSTMTAFAAIDDKQRPLASGGHRC
jgi:hypothetical protein